MSPTHAVLLAHLHLVHVVHMAAMGLLVSLVAPGLATVAALFPALDRPAAPARVALPGFAVLFALVTIGTRGTDPTGPAATVAHVLLLAGAVLFWAPVLGVRHRLPDDGRAVYLLLAGPVLSLAALWPVARGDGAGALALVVGTLPIGAAAIVMAWSRITDRKAMHHEGRGARLDRWEPAAAIPR